MKSGKRGLSVALVLLGVILILCAAIMLLYTKLSPNISVENATETLRKAEAQLPTIIDQIPEERRNNTMSSMEINRVNIVGLIEIPKYSFKLPVYSTWDKAMVSSVPCRYTGSIYDRSLIIGAADREGQMDFVKQLYLDDRIFITDMEGGRYSYRISKIDHTDNVKTEELQSNSCDLTIFVKSSLSMEYIVIRCVIV